MTENSSYRKDNSYPNLPDYLQSIQKVLIDGEVVDSKLAQRIRQRLAHLPIEILEQGQPLETVQDQESILYLKDYKGKFLRFCPGTTFYRCCGYRIIHIGENCPLNCSYCILKSYFQDKILKVWANMDDLFQELDKEFTSQPQKLFRVGTGEFTDSLALETITGYSGDLIEFLNSYPNVALELKSKIVDLSWIEKVRNPKKILPAWSLNSPEIVQTEEKKVAPLEERLKAAKECAQKGFKVCLHFDPIIYYPGWDKGYATVIDMIFDYLRPEDIAYLSLGSFRCMPELKSYIQKHWPESNYIYQEFITGMDGKLRLLRPLRIKQFRFLADRLGTYGLDKEIYFCMESDEVWKTVLGYTPKDLGGLADHLLKQTFGGRATNF